MKPAPFTFVPALVALLATACSTLGVPRHEGPPSDHFDGETFFNPWLEVPATQPSSGGSLRFIARRLAGSNQGEWPEWVVQAPGEPPPRRVANGWRARPGYCASRATSTS
jgi:hypothetical protein